MSYLPCVIQSLKAKHKCNYQLEKLQFGKLRVWLHKKLHKKLQSQWEKLRHKRLQKSLHTIYGVSRSKSMGKLHQKSYPPYMVFPVQSQWEKLHHKSYSLYMVFPVQVNETKSFEKCEIPQSNNVVALATTLINILGLTPES